jgi:hypothetical protein
MPDFTVTYRDGRTHVVTADKYGPYGENLVFTLGGEEIAIIARSDVESVMLAAIPEAELPPRSRWSQPGRSASANVAQAAPARLGRR